MLFLVKMSKKRKHFIEFPLLFYKKVFKRIHKVLAKLQIYIKDKFRIVFA